MTSDELGLRAGLVASARQCVLVKIGREPERPDAATEPLTPPEFTV